MLVSRDPTSLGIDPAIGGLSSPAEEDQSKTFFDALGPAFRTQTSIGSIYNSLQYGQPDGHYDPDYVPWKDVVGTKYEPYYREAADVPNAKQMMAWKTKIDAQEDDIKTIQSAGGAGTLATLGVSLFAEPLNLIPVGGFAVNAGRIGASALKTAAKVGALSGVATAAQEAVLQGTQVERPLGESVAAIGGSVIVGALLGGVGSAFLSHAQFGKLSKALETELRKPGVLAPDAAQTEGETVLREITGLSAEKAGTETLDDLTIAGKAAGFVARTTQKLNPLLNMLSSPSPIIRKIAEGLMENPLYLKKNAAAKASTQAVETIVKEYTGAVTDATIKTRELFGDARKAGFNGSYAEFRDRVGQAMRRADVDPGGSKEVSEAAGFWRAKVFDPLKKEAIELKRLPEDVHVDTAASYFSRMYNIEKIEAQEGKFLGIVRSWLSRSIKEIEGKPGQEATHFVSEADRADYIEDVARGIYDKITGRATDGSGIPHSIVATDRGPLKERTFSIPDNLIEDFLVHDIEKVGHRYARVMGAEVELTRKFGDSDLKKTIGEAKDSYRKLRDQISAKPGLTPQQREGLLNQLGDREKSDIRHIEAVRDMLRGTYQAAKNTGNWGRTLAAANAYNYIRLMGGVVLSSLTDLARPMMVHGLMPWFKDGLRPLITNLKTFKAASREGRLAGNLAERYQHSRMANWAELTDPYSNLAPAERMLQNMTTGFSKLSGISAWTDFMKSIASGMTQTRILRGVGKYASLGEREKRYLAFLGIDEEGANRIAKQFETHGSIDSDIHIAGTDHWQDDIARRMFRAALNKDVDSIIVTRGIGDVPLFAHTPTGRALLQFKSFAIASHQRAFMRGLQEGNAGVLSGMITSTAIGMFISWAKAVETNHLDKWSNNPGTLVAEGLDRSGLFTALFEINNIAEKIGIPGIYAGLGKVGQIVKPDAKLRTTSSRYASRSVASSFAGPSFGLLSDVIGLAGSTLGVLKGEETPGGEPRKFTESDAGIALKLLPGRTLPGIRSILDYYAAPALKDAVDSQ